jgi:nucleotide-binding universal stress UspA family protein
MFHSWLVAHDFDAASDAAADAAARIAAACAGAAGPGRVVLCHVVHPVPLVISPDVMGLPDVAAGLAAVNADDVGKLARAAASLAERFPSLTVRPLLLTGPTVTTLLGAADEESVDAIAVGSRGLTGLAHALLGSTSEAAVRKSKKPVLVVKVDEYDAG